MCCSYMHTSPRQLPMIEELSKSWPSREIAAGRWLTSGLHAFLKRPLTFSTMGTIPLFCTASTHPNGTLTRTRTPADTHACTNSPVLVRDGAALWEILFFPVFAHTHQIIPSHILLRSARGQRSVKWKLAVCVCVCRECVTCAWGSFLSRMRRID